MISLEAKPETKVSSPIGLAHAQESAEEPTVSFSELLKGVKTSKDDKEVGNGSFVLALDSKEEGLVGKKDTLASLLKNDGITKELDALELNPALTKSMSVTELKELIVSAKQFIKNKILTSDDFKTSEIKNLPKTLKGLVDMAKTFGIDMSKVTLEEVSAKPTNSAKQITKIDLLDEKTKTQSKNSLSGEVEDLVDIKPKTVKNKSLKPQIDSEVLQQDTKIKDDVRVNDKRVDTLREVKSTPLFKATEKTELTTEQIVQTKQFKVENKTPKSKADETLKLLLRGEKPNSSGVNMTADFSVATAKVIAPTATSEASKSLEQLLRGAPEEATSKTDGLTTSKADSFEVKLNEAKQMVKYLSQDVKTAIEDYKSPFTRVKVQLNPAKMGEVDITIVSRGKNLHVNISSNTAAINTLAINANELKTQLNTNGIQNASLNFNNSEQNNQNASQQQHNRKNEREADEEYNYFDNEEHNEEVLSSLEIVVPNYA